MASLADLMGRPIEKTKQFALYDKLRRQHFGENDSTLASALMHPIEAAGRGADWFQNQVNTAAGTGGDDYGGDPYLQRDQQAGAALNLAGLANMGAMPAAPRSAGGTIGTVVKPQFQDNMPASLADSLLDSH